MQCRLEQLEKKCKLSFLKKRGVPLLLGVVFAGLVFAFSQYFFYESPQKADSKKRVIKKKQKREVKTFYKEAKTIQREEPVKQCVSIQLILATKKNRHNFYKFKKRVEKLGFDCHIRKEDVLKNIPGQELLLMCNTVKNREELRSSIRLAKKYGLDYQIRSDECGYMMQKKRTLEEKKRKKRFVTVEKESVKESPPVENSSSYQLESKPLNIENMIALFHKRQSYNIAIKIAKRYYVKKDFKNALKWAQKANSLDRAKEDAWILYAKSLAKLGYIQKAKKILHIYLDYRDSQEAKKVLKELQ